FLFSRRSRHTIFSRDWSSDVCSSDLRLPVVVAGPDTPMRERLVGPRRYDTCVAARPLDEDERLDPVAVPLPELGRVERPVDVGVSGDADAAEAADEDAAGGEAVRQREDGPAPVRGLGDGEVRVEIGSAHV